MIIERRVAPLLHRGSRDYCEMRDDGQRSLLVGRIVAVNLGENSRSYYIVEGNDFTVRPGEPRTRYTPLYLDTVMNDFDKAEEVLLSHLGSSSATPVSFWRTERS